MISSLEFTECYEHLQGKKVPYCNLWTPSVEQGNCFVKEIKLGRGISYLFKDIFLNHLIFFFKIKKYCSFVLDIS